MNPIKAITDNAVRALEALDVQVSGVKAEFGRLFSELSKYQAINFQEVQNFLKEPWCILPKSREEWWVVIPRWVGTQVGWLERATETYNIFVVNRYSHMLGGISDELREKLQLPEPIKATVENGELKTGAKITRAMQEHLGRQIEPGRWAVKVGHEFELMAELIRLGSLPFSMRPVNQSDLNLSMKLGGPLADLRDYERAAWAEFLKRGSICITWPFGVGKSTFGAYAVAVTRGKRLIVVPSRTLVEQWEGRLREWCGIVTNATTSSEVRVVTYHSWETIRKEEWDLVVFDEAHRLPANTFSRFATLRTKYRIGLSGSPYREDGRTNYIFALTGFPIPVDWTEFIRKGIISKPEVEVRIVSGWTEKVRIAEEEVKSEKGRTIVFCDTIAPGRFLASRLRCPHVYGDTKNRLDILNGTRIAVVSRVGDEGLSLPDLRKVIEVDFHGSSRRQEAQRVGRLFHSNGKGQHIVLMTRDEFDRYEGRFLALEEKGIKVEVRA
ncbi:MAG: DEAD/DEAH box helicase family protein [Thermoplasmata archaeon]